MMEILIRFLVGGLVVSVFSVIGDMLKPKSFAGLFGAAPSVALATIALTVKSDGTAYVAREAHSMMAGCLAFSIYVSVVSWVIMHYKLKALWVTMCAMPVWFGVAFALWSIR